jgi:hypothetical protein
VPLFNAARGGNTPRIDEGYYRGHSCGTLVHKFLQNLWKRKTFVELKLEKTVRSPKVKPPWIARSKAGMMLFVSTNAKIRSLVPHRKPREHCPSIKGEAFQLPQVCVRYRITGGRGNTPYDGKGYYQDRLCEAIMHESFLRHRQKLERSFNPSWWGWRFLIWSSPRVECSTYWGWTSSSRGYCWERVFTYSRRVPTATLASRVFRFLICSIMQKEYSSCFTGSRMCLGPPRGGWGGLMARRLVSPRGWRPEVGGGMLTVNRRLPRPRDMWQHFIDPQKAVS